VNRAAALVDSMQHAPLSWPQDHASAADRVASYLPESTRARLRPIGEGDTCLAFRQNTRVVRVAKHGEAAAALGREECVLSGIAARLPLSVPQPTFIHAADGCAFSIHARIPGVALSRTRWERLSPHIREVIAAELGGFLEALHTLPDAYGMQCHLPTLDGAAEFAAAIRSAALRLAARHRTHVPRRLDAALTAWSMPPVNVLPAPSLLHCDIAPGHVLFDPRRGRLTGVIDFGDLAIGDAARDFIYIYEDFGSDMLAAVLRHYAREDTAILMPRIHMWCILNAMEWTIEESGPLESADVEQRFAEIATELDRLGERADQTVHS
jgi:aminoglycoside 2''-phosphotransferase